MQKLKTWVDPVDRATIERKVQSQFSNICRFSVPVYGVSVETFQMGVNRENAFTEIIPMIDSADLCKSTCKPLVKVTNNSPQDTKAFSELSQLSCQTECGKQVHLIKSKKLLANMIVEVAKKEFSLPELKIASGEIPKK
jgi:hypothetical protein